MEEQGDEAHKREYLKQLEALLANNIHYNDACNCLECRQKKGLQPDRPVKMLGEPLTPQNSEMMCSEDLRSVKEAEAGSTCDDDVDLTSL